MEKKRFCLCCGEILGPRHKIIYCSNKCQHDHQYKLWVSRWKSGVKAGNIGISSKNISRHLKRYLHEKFKYMCCICGWKKKHPITGNVPLEIEHVDGNSENNNEENLKLLCPNCHALTPFFKNLNRGNGRKWRTDKYIKN